MTEITKTTPKIPRPMRRGGRSFIEHPKHIYWSARNHPITPDMVALNSNKKYWFDCPCGYLHEFEARASTVARGGWCPYCRPGARKLCKCDICFKKSIASHPKSKYWSSKNKLEPWQVTLQSHQKKWFDCSTCGHTFDCSPAHITNKKNPRWCPYCSQRKLCESNDCDDCYNNSFASYTLYKNITWSKKNKDTPRQILKKSHAFQGFDCSICNHEFEARAYNMSRNRGAGCPYCAHQKLCENDECEFCFNKSFKSYKGNILWSISNKEQNTRKIFKQSNNIAWFSCNCAHHWETAISHISNGRGCPICKNKTEKKLLEWLQKQTFIKKVQREYKPKWFKYHCIIKGKHKIRSFRYRYDFLITLQNGKQLIIELDGCHHHQNLPHWKSIALHNQIRDAYKERKARQHKLKVIRILQEDVWFDRGDWEEALTKQLQ